MNLPFGPFNSPEDFANWAQVPANAAKLEAYARRALAGEMEEMSPETRAGLAEWLAIHELQTKLRAIRAKAAELMTVAARPPGSMDADERLRLCQRLMDEITDAMLDVPEPHRTELFQHLLPAREFVRSLKIDEG